MPGSPALIFSRGIERPDVGDELPPIRQVDVMTPSIDGSTRHAVVLSLKRSGRVYDGVDLKLAQEVAQPWLGRIDSDCLLFSICASVPQIRAPKKP
jgi:hypothetical protein